MPVPGRFACLWMTVITFLSMAASSALAQNCPVCPQSQSSAQARAQSQATPSPWSLAVFGGVLSENKVGAELLPPQKFRNDWMAGVGLNYRFWRWGKYLDLEVEPMFAQHFGDQAFGELAAAVMARWRLFPWNGCLATTFALGEGLSYAFQILAIELRADGAGPVNNLNNLIVFEFSLAPASARHLALIFRLHHRSVALSLFGENRESNFFCMGLRWRF